MKLQKRIERRGKQVIRDYLGRVLRPDPVAPGDFDPGDVSRVLIVRQDSRLGNLVLMTPFLAGIRDAFPDAVIDLLVADDFDDVARTFPEVDRVLVFEKDKAKTMPWRYFGLIGSLRRNGYDVAVDVTDGHHLSLNNILLVAISGARYRVGYDREDAASFLNVLIPPPPEGTFMADALLGLARYMSSRVTDYPMRFYLREEDRTAALCWLDAHGIGDSPFIVVHPGGRGKKQWGARNFAEFIERLSRDSGAETVLIAGPDDHDIVGEITGYVTGNVAVLKNVSVGTMAAVIAECGLFVSNDTGPMHVASALGRPTVGVFTSSDYRVYGPRGAYGRTVVSDSWSPSVDDVLTAVRDLVGAS